MEAGRLLVIGYGNTLRRDDGVGVRVAEAVADLRLPGVRTMACQQLTPEMAGTISDEREVVFVDAVADAADRVELREVKASAEGATLAHSCEPGLLLKMAGELFGSQPRGWLLTVPAEEMGVGEGLTDSTQRHAREAVGRIEELLSELQGN